MSTRPALKRPSLVDPVTLHQPIAEAYEFAPSLIMVNRPNDAAAEAIRAMRTHVMAQHFQEGRRALAVCGASVGVGCTFVAANLAVSLAQIGLKTLLLEADLRRPGLGRLIKSPRNGLGLAHCLASDEDSFGDAIEADVMPNLSVCYSGGPASHPQELLGSNRFRQLMEFCLREYDATIVDTPPANTCSDARRVSTVVGYSLIVARRNVTFIDDIKTLASQLEADRAKVVGTVLNEG